MVKRRRRFEAEHFASSKVAAIAPKLHASDAVMSARSPTRPASNALAGHVASCGLGNRATTSKYVSRASTTPP